MVHVFDSVAYKNRSRLKRHMATKYKLTILVFSFDVPWVRRDGCLGQASWFHADEVDQIAISGARE